jgi:flagellar biogenesis protein FliO
MNDADNLALLGRVMGGLVVVLVLIGLAARIARRTRGLKGTTGLRVIDRIGLSREANLTVVEVANRVLLLGVTAHGVTMLADLDAAAIRDDDDRDDDEPDAGAGSDQDDRDPEFVARPVLPVRAQPIANPGQPRVQRRPVPTGVALEEYPDLASALRAAGRTSGSSPQATRAGPVITSTAEELAPAPSDATYGPGTPRTRAEARAEARARASVAAQTAAQEQDEAQDGGARAPASSGVVDRLPAQRNQSAAVTKKGVAKKRPVPRSTGQASGSVLSPRTWRQGIEALRNLTVRRG